MADETKPVTTTAQPTDEITAIKAENIALKKMLDEHKAKLDSLAGAAEHGAQLGSKFDEYKAFAAEQYRSRFETAPEAVKEHFKDISPDDDPLTALKSLNTFNDFIANVEKGIREKYGIKEAATDPTKRAPDEGKQKVPTFTSNKSIIDYLVSQNTKKE